MITLDPSGFDSLVRQLARYQSSSTIPYIAGLLTVPALHCKAPRLETLVHLAVTHCNGTGTPNRAQVSRWINSDLASISSLEDPSEDVFIANIETSDGNRLIFQGDWAANGYYTQSVLDVLGTDALVEVSPSVASSSLALLKVSDWVANRLGFERWTADPCIPRSDVALRSDDAIHRHLTAVTLTDADLATLGITREVLEPFLFLDEHKALLSRQQLGHTSLERRPIVEHESSIVLALPSAVGPAIRRFIIEEVQAAGAGSQFSVALDRLHRQQVHLSGLRHLRGPSHVMSSPKPPQPLPRLSHRLVSYDDDKYIQLIILHDPKLKEVTTTGIESPLPYSRMANANLSTFINTVATSCQAQPGFSQGWTILVVGGIGRGVVLDIKDAIDPWIISLISIADFLMLAADVDSPIDNFLKFLAQQPLLAASGTLFFAAGSDYDIYCHWLERGYRLFPADMPPNVDVLWLPPDVHQLAVRTRVRHTTDAHAVPTPSGQYTRAVRFTMGAIVDTTNQRPTYVVPEYLRNQILAGLVTTDRGITWLVVLGDTDDPERAAFARQLWTGLMDLFDRMIVALERQSVLTNDSSFSIVLDVSQVIVPITPRQTAPSEDPFRAGFVWEISDEAAIVRCPPNLLQHFQQPTNTGERLIFRALAMALLALHTRQPVDRIDAERTEALASAVVADPGARILHVFTSPNVFAQVMSLSEPGSRHRFPAIDYTFSKFQLWRKLCSGPDVVSPISSKPEGKEFLNALVSHTWPSIRDLLRQYDRRTFIRQVLTVHEHGIADRFLWHRTARAMLALRSDALALWRQSESERTNIQLPARIAIEMAVCECPVQGGRPPSQWDVDLVIAQVHLLIKTATDSDAVYHEIVKPDITILPGGDYILPGEFYDDTMKPFVEQGWTDVYRSASEEYERSYQNGNGDSDDAEPNTTFEPDFIEAYAEEYGITPTATLRALVALGEWAMESRTVVIETTMEKMKARLREHAELTTAEAERFMRSFSLVSRPKWEVPPDGIELRDIKPWRYTRRLSVVAKPMIGWEEGGSQAVVFGVGTVMTYIMNVMQGSMEGQISQRIFNTKKMKRYRGDIIRRLGSRFAKETGRQLETRGWCTRIEVPMGTFGAPKKHGDVDVLAWNAEGQVVVVECKRLQMARTVAEVAELCKRFRGEANDDLQKHLRRVEWLRRNPAKLQPIVGYVPEVDAIDDRVVTNVRVPMSYLSSLPIAAGKIGPLVDGSFAKTPG